MIDIHYLPLTNFDKSIIKNAIAILKQEQLPYIQCIACVYSHKVSETTIDDDIENIEFETHFDIVMIGVLKKLIKSILKIYLSEYKKTNTHSLLFDCWLNMQYHDRKHLYKEDFHNHENFMDPTVKPHKSFVYYIQMPNNLHEKDGVLFYKIGDNVHDILPNESDLFVMNSDLIHCPNSAFNSTLDRIIVGINVAPIMP